MKEFLILVAIILLGLLILRTAIGAVTLILYGKAGHVEKASTFTRIINLFETAAVVTGYIILVANYYS